jgi:hypothetical protein
MTVILIPYNGSSQTLIEQDGRFPPKLALEFRSVQGVPTIMTRAVFNMPNEASRLVENIENVLCHVVVSLFLARANIVNLSRSPIL